MTEIRMEQTTAGDVITFQYFGGSDYGGRRTKVKVLKAADENAGNVLGQIQPYEVGCLRNYTPGNSAHCEIVGAFDPDAISVNFKDVQSALIRKLGNDELAKLLVQKMTTLDLCEAALVAGIQKEMVGDANATLSGCSFNETTQQVEFWVEKGPRFLNSNKNDMIYIEVDGETITVCANGKTVEVNGAVCKTPQELVDMLNDYL